MISRLCASPGQFGRYVSSPLNLTAARLYRDGAQQHYAFPEGIELNPFFRDDVAKIRTISFRFFLLLFFVVGLLLIMYELNIPEAFAVVWGMFVGIQLANHCRHI